MDTLVVRGSLYARVTSGDASDISWDKTRIQDMGFEPIVRQAGDDIYRLYLPIEQVKAYEAAVRAEQDAYWSSPEGIEEQKRIGRETRDFDRSPEGRLEKHLDRLYRKGKL